MAKVIMTCGKICSGKSTYANKISKEQKAVILSVDEITLALFGQHTGEKHDEYVEKLKSYLFDKSVEIVRTGVNVILDWGFWTKQERVFAREFYKSKNIECEFHYIDVSDDIWKQRIAQRNSDVSNGKVSAYYIDDNLAKKFESLFEKPDDDDVDFRVS